MTRAGAGRWVVGCILVSLSGWPGADGHAQVRDFAPVTDEMLAAPDPGDWLNWRRTLDGWGYSPLDQIERTNVGGLQLQWSWGLEPGVSQTTPLVYDGVMYIVNPGAVVHALDARTGELIWEYRREMEDRLRPNAQMRSLAIYQDKVLLNTSDARVVALDARTGEVRWDTPAGPEGVGFRLTNGPLVADGVVVVGLTGCSQFREEACYIVGIDGDSGRELWRTSTVARPGEPGGDTWGDLEWIFRAGGDAWMTGSYDPEARLIYWGTAQAKPWSRAARGTGGAVELYTNSTLALDPRTGEIQWYYQHIPAESHDMDEAFERILVDYDGRRSVFTMGKLGILWEVDRDSGEFVRAVDLGYQNLIDVNPGDGEVSYRPGMLPEVDERIHFCPSTGGFKSLRAMAYHPDTEAFYIPLNLNCQSSAFLGVRFIEGAGGSGGVRDRTLHFHPDSPDQLGEFVAMNMRTGEKMWSHRRRAPYNTAALTTGGGLVFVGDWDRHVFAYDTSDGTELWRTRLPTMSNGFPITYAVDGVQYIAFIAGPSPSGLSWAGAVPRALIPELKTPQGGSGVFVFALPQ